MYFVTAGSELGKELGKEFAAVDRFIISKLYKHCLCKYILSLKELRKALWQ